MLRQRKKRSFLVALRGRSSCVQQVREREDCHILWSLVQTPNAYGEPSTVPSCVQSHPVVRRPSGACGTTWWLWHPCRWRSIGCGGMEGHLRCHGPPTPTI